MLLAGLAVLAGCGDDGRVADAGLDGTIPATPPSDARPPTPDLALPFSLVGVAPATGPFTGGRRTVLRGSAFRAEAFASDCASECGAIHFGAAEAEGILVLDEHRIEVVVPPGTTGPVDVVVEQGAERATLESGYRYEPLAVTPPSGTDAGGTLVTLELEGGAFAAGDLVRVGGLDCTGVSVESASTLRCRTPAHPRGPVGVRVEHGGGGVTEAESAYWYVDGITREGGLAGGPIAGALEVAVLDGTTSAPVADALVLVGSDLASGLQARTDGSGRATIAEAGLAGPVDLHVAKRCYETTSFLGADARRVTVLLIPRRTTDCPSSIAGPPGPGTTVATVAGELLEPWSLVPAPAGGEARIAYVFTTRVRADVPNPSAAGGGMNRVEELEGDPRFRIAARPGGVAVIAVAGVEDQSTGDFAVYALGVARGILLEPDGERSGLRIPVDIPLDRALDIDLPATPPLPEPGPATLVVRAYPVMGEGALFEPLLAERRASQDGVIRVAPLPALEGPLADARYTVEVEKHYGSRADGLARAGRVLRGLAWTDTLVVDDLLTPPRAEAPADQSAFPADGVMRWTTEGAAPDLVFGQLADTSGAVWRFFAPGTADSATLPDLMGAEGVDGLPTGSMSWSLFTIRVQDQPFDTMTYRAIDARRWSHWTSSIFTIGAAP